MKENLLIVDDNPDNLRLLTATLSEQGYHIRKALNGAIALKSIEQVPPDLILLDITMPGMNGYEVCQVLKNQPTTQEIPIIFISALDAVLDKVQAFEVGGSDYITKPFQGQEVIARIENQLTIQRQRRQLQAEIQERQKAEQALQMSLQIVSHDLQNPVLGMAMILNNYLKNASPTEPILFPSEVIQRMAQSCDRQLALINSLVMSQQLETQTITLNRQPLDLGELLQNFAAEWHPQLEAHPAQLILDYPASLPPVSADSNLIWRVLENLVANALKYNPQNPLIMTIRLEPQAGQMICSVADNGIGIPADLLTSLFQAYQRGNRASQSPGFGLGLYLCRQIIEAHQGKISATSEPGKGLKIIFTLPITASRPAEFKQ